MRWFLLNYAHSPVLQVKKSLCVLLQHQLVTHQEKTPTATLYRIDPHTVLLRVQIPCWIRAAKKLIGDAGELVVEDILQQGHTSKAEVGVILSRNTPSWLGGCDHSSQIPGGHNLKTP